MGCDLVPSAVPTLPRASERPAPGQAFGLSDPWAMPGFWSRERIVSLAVANLLVRAGWAVGTHCPVRKVLTGVPEHSPGVWATVPLCPRSHRRMRAPQGSS